MRGSEVVRVFFQARVVGFASLVMVPKREFAVTEQEAHGVVVWQFQQRCARGRKLAFLIQKNFSIREAIEMMMHV